MPTIGLQPDLPRLQLLSNTHLQRRYSIERGCLQPVYRRLDVPTQRGAKRRRTSG